MPERLRLPLINLNQLPIHLSQALLAPQLQTLRSSDWSAPRHVRLACVGAPILRRKYPKASILSKYFSLARGVRLEEHTALKTLMMAGS